jgi:hypothetical protein
MLVVALLRDMRLLVGLLCDFIAWLSLVALLRYMVLLLPFVRLLLLLVGLSGQVGLGARVLSLESAPPNVGDI